MDVAAVYDDVCPGSVEAFVFQLPNGTTIDGVSICGSESVDVEFIRTSADFLIGG